MSTLWLRGLGLLKENELSPRDETTRAKNAEVVEKVRIASDYWAAKAVRVKQTLTLIAKPKLHFF